MRTMPQEKHIERFLILRFNETDELCKKTHNFCNELINYLREPNLPEVHLVNLLGYTDDFVLPILPFLQDSVIQYQKITGYIDALDEFLDEYRKNTVGYKRRNSREFHEVLELRNQFMKSYRRIIKKINKELRGKIQNELPELIISVYGYVVHRITQSDKIMLEFNNVVVSKVAEDIRCVRDQKQDFEALQRLNNKINAITHEFLYDIESEFLNLFGYKSNEEYDGERIEARASRGE